MGQPDRARARADCHGHPARGRLLRQDVLTLLADHGQHRAPSVPELIIAATAELAGLTVLHCDKDFDLIASVTGQPAEWLSGTGTPAGSPGMGGMPGMTAGGTGS